MVCNFAQFEQGVTLRVVSLLLHNRSDSETVKF